jgi:hypothetical protein
LRALTDYGQFMDTVAEAFEKQSRQARNVFAAGVACAQGREPDWMISATAARAGRKRGVTPIPRRRHCVPRRHAIESGQLAGKPALLFVYLAVRDGSEGRNRFV